MVKPIWRRLPREELAAFREYLDGLSAGERPVYGLVGVRASWWTRLGGFGRPFVLLIRGGRIVVSKRSWRGQRAVSRRDYPITALQRVAVRRGPLLESVRLWFEDGYSVRIGGLPRHQSEPLRRLGREGPGVLDASSLTAEQLTNTHLACRAMGLPGGERPGPTRAQPTGAG